MKIGIHKETTESEKRVALTPEGVKKLVNDNKMVLVESGAGVASSYPDDAFIEAGAEIVQDKKTLFSKADLIVSFNFPDESHIKNMKEGAAIVCFVWTLQNKARVELLKKQKITAFAMEAIPRISRAQVMDALSSMSNIAGYKSVLIGANELDRYLPMMMTAAGTIPPAKVMVLGAGVAGLQAIATAKRLGAVVEAYDIRPAVKEQVESLGAKFIEVPIEEEEETETEGGYAKEASKRHQEKQKEVTHQHVKKSDIVITTALIPGKPAPKLVTREMVEDMSPGSVVVDLAAEQGGNCELTEADKTVIHNGVKIVGPLNLASTLAYHASKLYSKNILSLLDLLIKDDNLNMDFDDEIILNTTITHNGKVISPMLKEND
ncbi:MAG: Re/Si-specific NAD(P)(+) transhydrogenase subunit alpha [Balneolaceae bacterium]